MSQQFNLFDPDNANQVTVYGAGSVGSQLVSMLARIGVDKIAVWDADAIDSHNIAPSYFGLDNFGEYKVDALKENILRDTGVMIEANRAFYDGSRPKGTVCVCVDTMRARQEIWEKVKMNIHVDLLIDTRIAEHFIQLFVVRPAHRRDSDIYEQYLAYRDQDSAQQMCGRHSIIYVSTQIAALATHALSQFWSSGRTEFVRYEQLGTDVFTETGEESL